MHKMSNIDFTNALAGPMSQCELQPSAVLLEHLLLTVTVGTETTTNTFPTASLNKATDSACIETLTQLMASTTIPTHDEVPANRVFGAIPVISTFPSPSLRPIPSLLALDGLTTMMVGQMLAAIMAILPPLLGVTDTAVPAAYSIGPLYSSCSWI